MEFINMELDMLIKLGFSALLGMIIGLERELKKKPLGIKTCIVISVVSCLLTIVSIDSAYAFPHLEHITQDPMRLVSSIVSGVGFLGAGVILRKGNDTIMGLTTSALIWGASGLGITVGAGFYVEAIVGILLLMVSVELVPIIVRFIGPKQLQEKDLLLQLTVIDAEKIADVIELIKKENIKLTQIRIKDLTEDEHLLQLNITVHKKRLTTDVYYLFHQIPYVNYVEIESL